MIRKLHSNLKKFILQYAKEYENNKVKRIYKKDGINMAKQMIKVVSILLAVCFLMSITAAAAYADTIEKPNLADKDMAGMKMMKDMSGMKMMKEMSQEKNVFIRNLIFIKNLVIIKTGGRHPLLRAAMLKKAAENKNAAENAGMTDTGMTDTGTTDTGTTDTGMADTGMTSSEQPLPCAACGTTLQNATA